LRWPTRQRPADRVGQRWHTVEQLTGSAPPPT
jgi:hypothetical protein